MKPPIFYLFTVAAALFILRSQDQKRQPSKAAITAFVETTSIAKTDPPKSPTSLLCEEKIFWPVPALECNHTFYQIVTGVDSFPGGETVISFFNICTWRIEGALVFEHISVPIGVVFKTSYKEGPVVVADLLGWWRTLCGYFQDFRNYWKYYWKLQSVRRLLQ